MGGKYSKSLSTLPSTSGIRPMRLLSFFERKVDTIGKMTLVIGKYVSSRGDEAETMYLLTYLLAFFLTW